MSKSRVAERSAAYALNTAAEPAFGASFDLLATAPQGVAKLRELILSLAFRGGLLPQGPNDESALVLLLRVRAEKERLVTEGVISGRKLLEAGADSEVEHELPEGWVWARLPELYFTISPGSKKLPTSAIKTHGLIPVIDQGKSHVAGYTDDASLKLQLPGPVIIFGDHTTEVKYVDFDFVAGADGVKILRPILQNEKYFFLQLSAFKLESRGYARHFKVLNSKMFAVAPLAEQARIVARVEELMQLCDALEAHGRLQDEQHARLVATLFNTLAASESAEALAENWQRIATHFDLLLDRPEAVDALEQTLLQLAVRGLLVPQDPTDESFVQLLERLAKKSPPIVPEKKLRTFKGSECNSSPYTLPPGWGWAPLWRLVENMGSGWSPACEAGERTNEDLWAVLRTTAVQVMQFRPRENKAIPSKLDGRPDIQVNEGDILVTRAGPMNRVGISCCVDHAPPRLMLSDKIVRFQVIDNEMMPSFVVLALNAGWTKDQLEAAKTGMAASQVNISQVDLRQIQVPVCSKAEQHRIVARVEELRRLCADLRERLQQARATQSRLADALVSAAPRPPAC
jgi:type I restriction enzyme S subunit